MLDTLQNDFFEKADQHRAALIACVSSSLRVPREDVEDAIQNLYEYFVETDEWMHIAIADLFPVLRDNVFKRTLNMMARSSVRSKRETSGGQNAHVNGDETTRSPELTLEAKQRLERLDERQKQIAESVLRGETVEMIAMNMRISQRTVIREIDRIVTENRRAERTHPYDGRWNTWPKPRRGYDEQGVRSI
jgi:DNA-directed RNA polymerase specialized sigma subunit